MKQKKLLALMVVSVLIAWNVWSTFAWGNLGGIFDLLDSHKQDTSQSSKVTLNNFVKNMDSKTVSYSEQITSIKNRLRKVHNSELSKILHTNMWNIKNLTKIVTTNPNLKQKIENTKKQVAVVKTAEALTLSPINMKWTKGILEKRLTAVIKWSANWLSATILNKLWWKNSVDQFDLKTKFNPNKAVTFDNIKMMYISNLTLDETLLNCSEPDQAVMWLCVNIWNLIEDLTSQARKLTINDVYKLQVYSATISEAIYYEWTLQRYKKWAIVLWIDQNTHTATSVDIVRSYTQYDDNTHNDVLPIVADSVLINVTKTKPVVSGNDPEIILGLNQWAVVGMNVYPLEKSVNIPYADAYKTMKLGWLTKWCSNGYKSSFWFGNGKLWISHNGSNLTPSWTKWIEFNLAEKCYNTFSK